MGPSAPLVTLAPRPGQPRDASTVAPAATPRRPEAPANHDRGLDSLTPGWLDRGLRNDRAVEPTPSRSPRREHGGGRGPRRDRERGGRGGRWTPGQRGDRTTKAKTAIDAFQASPDHPLVLFDLNGVLMLRRHVSAGKHALKVRPGLELLQRLVDEGCQLGIYSSCMQATIVKCLEQIEAAFRGGQPDLIASTERDSSEIRAVSKGDGWVEAVTRHKRSSPPRARDRGGAVSSCERGETSVETEGDEKIVSGLTTEGKTRFAQTAPPLIFSPVLDRSHCEPRKNGPTPWATFKPLRKHASNVRWTVLVDDSDDKIVPEERDRALIVPTWTGIGEEQADKAFVAMIDGLVQSIRESRKRVHDASNPTGATIPLDLTPARAALRAVRRS